MLLYGSGADGVTPELMERRQLERALFLAPDASAPDPLDVLTHAELLAVEHHDAQPGAAGTDALAVLRQLVWVAAVRGRDADGSAVPTGWEIDFRAQRYAVLARRSGWSP